jgi:hypothetical protein
MTKDACLDGRCGRCPADPECLGGADHPPKRTLPTTRLLGSWAGTLGVHGPLRIGTNPQATTPLVSDSAEEKVNDLWRNIIMMGREAPQVVGDIYALPAATIVR